MEYDRSQMDGEEKFWVNVIGIIAIAATLVITAITIGVCYHDTMMVENNYEQVSERGVASFVWQKHSK